MSTKKIIPVLLMSLGISLVTPVFSANLTPVKTEIPKEVRAQQIENRLIEIRDMDKTSLSKAEKKDLRKEVKGLKKEARNRRHLLVRWGYYYYYFTSHSFIIRSKSLLKKCPFKYLNGHFFCVKRYQEVFLALATITTPTIARTPPT